jgi:hypothetical protein
MAKKSKKGPASLWDKVNAVDPTFAGEVYALSNEQLKEKLVAMASYRSELEAAKEKDTDLASKREELKTANETYSKPLKAVSLKNSLIIETLKERGNIA